MRILVRKMLMIIMMIIVKQVFFVKTCETFEKLVSRDKVLRANCG